MTGLVDVLTGHAAAELIHALLRAGILDELREPRSPVELAAARRLDEGATRVALEFAARTTGVLAQRADGRFVLAPRFRRDDRWRGLLEKFVGAYGPALRAPVRQLARRARPGIDQRALARAFAWDEESPRVVETILGLAPTGVLDLGCGRGALLAQVCAEAGIEGWGIDPSVAMCRAARARVARAGPRRDVHIRRGGVLEVGRLLSPRERRRVSLVHAASLFNEMTDDVALVAVLTRLRRWFPGRWLIVVDYLGALGRGARAGPYTYLTDLVQALSRQGVPPPSHERWAALYRAAGARLVHAAEGRTLDLRWFIHVVRLGPVSAPSGRRAARRADAPGAARPRGSR